MSIGEAQRGTAAAPAHSEREPPWAIGVSALLIATGLARRPAARYSAARYSGRADNSGRADSSGRADNNELDPGRGRTKVCQFWAHATDDRSWKGPAPPAVAYVFAGGRGKKEIAAQLTGFEGVLHVDGYAAYTSLAGGKKNAGKIRLAFCLVHARRHFVDVHKTTNSPFAKEVIERIAEVYAIEARIRGLDADQRLQE